MSEQAKEIPITTRSYLGTLLIGTIPVMGFVLLYLWSKDKDVRESKQNLCKAYMVVQLALILPITAIAGVTGFLIGLAK